MISDISERFSLPQHQQRSLSPLPLYLVKMKLREKLDLAQWVSIATIDNLDGSFLEQAINLEPDNLRVLYALLEKQPNIEGTRNQRAFEQRIVNRILNLYPEDPTGTEASAIVASSSDLPLDFVNRLLNPL